MRPPKRQTAWQHFIPSGRQYKRMTYSLTLKMEASRNDIRHHMAFYFHIEEIKILTPRVVHKR